MKYFYSIIFVPLLICQASYPVTHIVPSPINYVNMNKFYGLWYETARTYNSFEENCVAASIEYKFKSQNSFDVKNRCFEYEIEGELIEYNGTAKPIKGDNFASLEKTYYWFFTKEYHIIYLEDDYSTAIMSDKKLENLWIMHRSPIMDEEKLKKLVNFLKPYMDTSRLIFTKQDPKGRYK